MNDNNINPQRTNEVLTKNKKGVFAVLTSWKFLLAVSLILLGTASFVGFRTATLVNKYSGKVYPGAHLFNRDISGLSQAELHSLIEGSMDATNRKKILISANGNNYELPYSSLDPVTNADELEKQILEFGKNDTFISKIKLMNSPSKRDYELTRTFSEEKLNTFVTNLSNEIDILPVNATINITGNSVTVSPDKTGYKLNSEELLSNIKATLANTASSDVTNLTANVAVTEATIKAASLSTVNNKIATFSTKIGNVNSGINIQVASNNINNTILMPGESFSTEKGIGPTTIERGFVSSNTYVAGRIVPGIGGGVCQVASTLYNTMLRSGIIPTERSNHMMKVSYVPMGLDATLADNLIDLKFTNPYEFPIIIKSYVNGSTLTIDFWSNDTVKNGITYEPKAVQSGNLSAETYLYGYNSNGEVVFSKFIDKSTYQPLPQ